MSNQTIGLYPKDRKVLDWIPVRAISSVHAEGAAIIIELHPGSKTSLGQDKLVVSGVQYSIDDIISVIGGGTAHKKMNIKVTEDVTQQSSKCRDGD